MMIPLGLLIFCTYRNPVWIGRVNFSSLESPRLIHVNPDAVVMKLLVQLIKSSKPNIGALVVEPVNEHGDLWPNLIDKVVVVGLIAIKS